MSSRALTLAVKEEHMHALNHEEVARLAYQFWEERGCPFGSSEVDWWRAEQELLARPETAEPVGNQQAIEGPPRLRRHRKAHV
jgi:hypothetical protein